MASLILNEGNPDSDNMAKSYVKFEVSNEVVAKTYEALGLAKQSGSVRKGANEVTKSVERGLASFVVIATDVEPEEVVMHIPTLCEQKKIAYSFVPSKMDLGKSIGLTVPCAAIAVENQGSAANAIRDVVGRTTGTAQHKTERKDTAQQAHQQQKPQAEKPRREKPVAKQQQEAQK